jgi:hypothetical protein
VSDKHAPEAGGGGAGGPGGGTGGGGAGRPPPAQNADRSFTEAPAAQTVLSLSQALLAPLDALLKVQVHAARSFLNFLLQMGYPHKPELPAAPAAPAAPAPAAGPGHPSHPGAAGPARAAGGGPPGAAPPGAARPASSPAPPPAPAQPPDSDGVPYQMDFYRDLGNGKKQKISIPTLALIPVSPLGVTSSEFSFEFYVRQIARHRQIRAKEGGKTALEKQVTGDLAEHDALPSEEVLDRSTRPWFLVDTPLSVQGTFAPPRGAPKDGDSADVDEARFSIKVNVGTMPMPAALEKLLTSLSQISTVDGDS